MAGYQCELCNGEEQAAVLITPLTGADTMAVGVECLPVALCGMLASSLGVDGDTLYEKAAELQAAAQAAAAAAAEPEPPAGTLPKRAAGASGRRPARPGRQAARTAAKAPRAASDGRVPPAGGEPQ